MSQCSQGKPIMHHFCRHALMLIFIPFAFFCAAAENIPYVAVTAIVEHPALDSVRDGILAELQENGYIQDENLKFQYQSAQGSSANAAQIAKQFVASKPDVIVAIATPSAQALAATTKAIPIVFTAVTDPVASKLTKSWDASGTNVTGVSDALALDKQIDLMLNIKPALKSVGYIYSPGEVNSTTILNQLQQKLAPKGIKIIAVPAQRTADIPAAARSLKGSVDLIYTTTDNNVVSAYESLAKVANESKIPLIASDPAVVPRGAVAALGMSYYDLGRQAGKMVIRILNGEKPGTMPIEIGNVTQLVINKSAAARQGVIFSDKIVHSANKIID
ncbi:ABC transporter substrate-binding protein [Utexia brackfieldae]|uniref:ABC transporter substrate-binding protein n=1 Tax=Utexia brackfieldae TaxID=3074108 RepID=UPI00370DC31B